MPVEREDRRATQLAHLQIAFGGDQLIVPTRRHGDDLALRIDVPGDLVTASGLDPDITLANAEFQLDRVAAKWADDKKLKADDVRKDIEALLQQKAYAPWGGAIGETLVNVLDVNLELHKRYGDPA